MTRSPATHAGLKIWAFRKDCWVVPKEFIELLPALEHRAFVVLCYIYNNEIPERGVRLSKKLIAEDCNMTVNKLVSIIDRLEDMGLIKVEQGKSGLSNVYHSYIFAGAREAYLRKAPKDMTISELMKRNPHHPRLKAAETKQIEDSPFREPVGVKSIVERISHQGRKTPKE